MFLKIEKQVKEIVKNLDPLETYIVGGYVRDKLMRRKPKDIDIVSKLSIQEISKKIFLKPYIVNDRFKTARFYFKESFIDYNSIEDFNKDLKRRDFTINSIACDLTGKIYDPLNGINDIENKIIRLSSRTSLTDDPVRILRAFRLKHQLGFNYNRQLIPLIKKASMLLLNSPKERIYIELKEIFSYLERGAAFSELHDAGLLIKIFPDLFPTLKFIHIKHKSWFLIKHLLNTATALDIILKERMPKELRDYANNNMFVLYMSSLFHDISKPDVFTIEKNKQKFYNHETLASHKIVKMLKRDIKIPNSEAEKISLLIKMHMRPHFLIKEDIPTDRSLFRLQRDSKNEICGLILLCMADVLASEGRIEREYFKLFKRMNSIKVKIEKKQIRFLNGNEIMDYFKLKPGKIIGEMLDSASSWAIENNVSDKKKIIDYLKEKFSL